MAEASVLAKGFAATSIEEIIAEAGITRSGFFYHFKDKNELAREMLRRYIASNEKILDDIFARGEELSEDPLQALLISLKLLAELLADLPGGHPGCLTASICYQERLFDREVVELNRRSVHDWIGRVRSRLARVAERYPPRAPVSIDKLAEMLACIIDGGIILSKLTSDPQRLADQVLTYRSLIRLQFGDPVAAPALAAAPVA